LQENADAGSVRRIAHHQELLLRQQRRIAISAALVVVAATLAAVPLAAFGGQSDSGSGAPDVAPGILDARAQVEQLNEQALDDAPPAVGASCGRTLEVEGVGPSCVTPEGLLRVESTDGTSHTIHGLDAPPLAADAYAPGSQARVNAAGPADITCVPASERHYVLVYARPSDAATRYSTIAPKLREEAYKMSAFVDGESQSVDPAKGKHLRFKCDGNAPVVLNATLANVSSSGVVFQDVVDGLKNLGYEYNGDGTNNERYIVYIDAPSPSGAAGTGHVFTPDSIANGANQNNKGGLYAIEYKWADGGGLPHWNVLLHETSHTMGAVVKAAPNDTGNGHCNDGQDIMCYADGGSTSSYSASTCERVVFDCNHDDYFNPTPAPGSYLDTHWNVAATYNSWLDHRGASDVVAPTSPVGVTQTGASNSAVGVSWAPATDDTGIVSYTVSYRLPDGAWRTALTTTRRKVSVPGLSPTTTYEIGVVAKDGAGNLSERVVGTATTNDRPDTTAPGAPTGVTAKLRAGTVVFTWAEPTDDVGVANFELRRLDGASSDPTKRTPRSAGSTSMTTISIPAAQLKSGVTYQFRVVARDDADNTSAGSRIVKVRVAKDTTKPVAPRTVRVSKRSTSKVTIAWSPARDNVGVTKYRVYQRVGPRWRPLVTLGGNYHALNISRLRPRTTYSFRVVALDGAGNASAPRAVAARTS